MNYLEAFLLHLIIVIKDTKIKRLKRWEFRRKNLKLNKNKSKVIKNMNMEMVKKINMNKKKIIPQIIIIKIKKIIIIKIKMVMIQILII